MTMRSRLQSLQHLVALYGVIEEMHATELQRVTATIAEAKQSIRAEEKIEWSARTDSHVALHSGDRMGWKIAITQQEAAASRMGLLERLRQERTQCRETAMEQYVASRMKRQQMKRLHHDIAQGIEAEHRRRTQAASDDRFLMRRRWIDEQEERHLPG